MAMVVQSEDLREALREAHEQKATGYLSVTGQEGTRQVYGTLYLLKGKLVKAEYANLIGNEAVNTMSTLSSPIVSFAPSPVDDKGGESLPEITSLIGGARVVKRAKAAKPSSAKGGFKIFPQVLLSMFFIALIPLAGLWYINSVTVKKQLETKAEQSLADAASTLSVGVDDWIDTMSRSLAQNAALADINSMNAAEQNPVLQTLTQAYDWTYLAFTMDASGQNIGRSDGKNTNFYGDRVFFQQAMQDQLGRQVLLGRSNGGKPAVTLASPIRDTSGQIIGVLAMANNLTDVSEEVASLGIGETGFAMLVDDQGRLIAHGDETFIAEEELQDISDHPALTAPTGELVTFENQRGEEVVALTREVALGWKLIVQQDYSDAFSTVLASQRNTLILLVVTLLIVIFTAFAFARRLVNPIESLTEAADNMSRGQLGAEIYETERSDEIGSLARAVERMGVSIKMAFEELNGSQEGAR